MIGMNSPEAAAGAAVGRGNEALCDASGGRERPGRDQDRGSMS